MQRDAADPVRRLLVVDDSQSVRLMVRLWLEPAGYQVLEAADGMRALEILRASADALVVLLDFQMPVLDGFGLLQLALAEGHPLTRHAYAIISGGAGNFPPAFTVLMQYFAIPMLAIPLQRETVLEIVAQLAARLRPPHR